MAKTLKGQLESTLFHLKHRRNWVPVQGWITDVPTGGNIFNAKKIAELDEQIIETEAALAGIARMRERRRNGERFYMRETYAFFGHAFEVASTRNGGGCHPYSDHPRYL